MKRFLIVCQRRCLLLPIVFYAFSGCHQPNGQDPSAGAASTLVIGIDGAEWTVIEDLWSQGKLPHLAALADRGVRAHLRTRYSTSPVIWTTIATGVEPHVHGITDFVVATPEGDVPVSSTVRKVPALWNMLTRVGKRTAVLGWWASWPAETIEGVVVSDRALSDIDNRVSPAEYLPRFLEEVEAARQIETLFAANEATRARDRTMAFIANRLVSEGQHDLYLVYFRGVDIASHNHWKRYRPQDFPESSPVDSAQRTAIPREYEAVDQAVGELLRATSNPLNVFVISDHGFRPANPEIIKVGLDFDRILHRLQFLSFLDSDQNQGVDLANSQLYTYASPELRGAKMIRCVLRGREQQGHLDEDGCQRAQEALRLELDRFRYQTGAPVFRQRSAGREARRGADFVVDVLTRGASKIIAVDGQPTSGFVSGISRISGTHSESTHGIFIAAGPDIDPRAELEGIRIHDIAPTLLYGLGLPVADDFAGRAVTQLFGQDFRRDHPLRSIDSWGRSDDSHLSTSDVDEELVRELRALGYLD